MKEIIEYTNSEDFKFFGNLVINNLNIIFPILI